MLDDYTTVLIPPDSDQDTIRKTVLQHSNGFPGVDPNKAETIVQLIAIGMEGGAKPACVTFHKDDMESALMVVAEPAVSGSLDYTFMQAIESNTSSDFRTSMESRSCPRQDLSETLRSCLTAGNFPVTFPLMRILATETEETLSALVTRLDNMTEEDNDRETSPGSQNEGSDASNDTNSTFEATERHEQDEDLSARGSTATNSFTQDPASRNTTTTSHSEDRDE
ncbi:hypothetical protein BCR39DRAFT_561172 [Naematelia encephala]|uniref:Uncharacterized protein n=1 Tax=Naematelia encephala TaxID=71784 RepID=A0A1Y2ASJ5_9TREE|nr:hypothetical protein BCR39DRAFT_561172 [Naematelia encephala]